MTCSNSQFNDPELSKISTYLRDLVCGLFLLSSYFGTGADHAIGMLKDAYSFTENHGIFVSLDYSKSFDEDKFAWEADGSTSYIHYKIAYQTSWNGFAIEVGAENTTLNNNDLADERIVASISRTFSF